MPGRVAARHCHPRTSILVELVIRVSPFSCPKCQRFFTPASAVMVPGAHATERFLEQAARLIRFSDIAKVAEFFAAP